MLLSRVLGPIDDPKRASKSQGAGLYCFYLLDGIQCTHFALRVRQTNTRTTMAVLFVLDLITLYLTYTFVAFYLRARDGVQKLRLQSEKDQWQKDYGIRPIVQSTQSPTWAMAIGRIDVIVLTPLASRPGGTNRP